MWHSSGQQMVSGGTCTSEYQALAELVKDILFVKQLLQCMLFMNVKVDVELFCDNKSTVEIVNSNLGGHSSVRHLPLDYKLIMQQLREERMTLRHIGTAEMTADIMTKGLNRVKHYYHLRRILQEIIDKKSDGVKEGEC
jgi:hypothetical protein